MSDRVPTEAYVYQPGVSVGNKGNWFDVYGVGGPGSEAISDARMTKELAQFICNLINENVRLRRRIVAG
jgi:hypothetical protein